MLSKASSAPSFTTMNLGRKFLALSALLDGVFTARTSQRRGCTKYGRRMRHHFSALIGGEADSPMTLLYYV
ncbi:hypothetical protein K438DRAFT_266974 [Mycena galopus ATCC 62051]|nr:hypothetical protein K438DRAFT_266974 [Mycena galopus ATCC 62051]